MVLSPELANALIIAMLGLLCWIVQRYSSRIDKKLDLHSENISEIKAEQVGQNERLDAHDDILNRHESRIEGRPFVKQVGR